MSMPPSRNATTLWDALAPGVVNALAAALDCAMIPPFSVGTVGTATLPVSDAGAPFPPACPVVSTAGLSHCLWLIVVVHLSPLLVLWTPQVVIVALSWAA
eukprot:5820019-Karenia_brevis.AAC.1